MQETPMMKLAAIMEKIIDLILLNILWFVCCIPVVTIGASTVALHYVIQKMAADEHYELWSDFFKCFRKNWKQGTAAAAVIFVMAAAAVVYILTGFRLTGTAGILCQILGILILFFLLAFEAMIFPLLAHYDNTFLNMMKNAIALGLTNPHIYVLNGAFVALWPILIWTDRRCFMPALFLIILIYVSAETYLKHLLLKRLYKRLEK